MEHDKHPLGGDPAAVYLSTFPVFIMVKFFRCHAHRSLIGGGGAWTGRIRWQVFWHIGRAPWVPRESFRPWYWGFWNTWNAIEQPMTFLKTKALWPLSLYLPQIAAEKLGLAMVASLVMLAPAVLIFRFGQKYLELGIQASGLKE